MPAPVSAAAAGRAGLGRTLAYEDQYAWASQAATHLHRQSESAPRQHAWFEPERGRFSARDMVEISQAAFEAVRSAARAGEMGKAQAAVVALIGAALAAVHKFAETGS